MELGASIKTMIHLPFLCVSCIYENFATLRKISRKQINYRRVIGLCYLILLGSYPVEIMRLGVYDLRGACTSRR
jgi:hypothetical protein